MDEIFEKDGYHAARLGIKESMYMIFAKLLVFDSSI